MSPTNSRRTPNLFFEFIIAIAGVMLTLLILAQAVRAGLLHRCPPGESGSGGGFLDDRSSDFFNSKEMKAAGDKPCHDELCRAINDIICATQAYHAVLLPNTMRYATPEAAERDYNLHLREMRALGREHPKRFPLYCKLIAGIAATVSGKDDPQHQDGWTAENLVNMALRADRPAHPCLAQMVRALPDNAETRLTVIDGRYCLTHIRICQKDRLRPPL